MQNIFKKINLIQYKPTLLIILAVLMGLVGLYSVIYIVERSGYSNSSQDQALSSVDKVIAKIQSKLDANPGNSQSMVDLCQAYLQKERQSADSSILKKCDSLLDEAARLDPINGDVVATQASVAYARHDFIGGLILAKKASSINKDKIAYYGLVADGQIELGQYSQAADSVQTMVNKRPDLSSYSRVAYIRELYGDIDGAKRALQQAISFGSSFSGDTASSQIELARLESKKDLDQAISIYMQTLSLQEVYPNAIEGLGKVAYVRGDYTQALEYFLQAFNILPIAQYAIDIGDTYTAKDDLKKAEQYYFLAEIAYEKSISNGVNVDFEKAVFLANHKGNLDEAVDLSKKALKVRPNIFTKDILAWSYYKQGKYVEAKQSIDEALVFGDKQPVILYHAGMIASKIKNNDEAKIYLNKAFEADKYFLETHFSLLDRQNAQTELDRLNKEGGE